MKKCLNCNVVIMDETDVCPLCRQVLKKDLQEQEFVGSMYPDLSNQNHKALLFENIVLFASICTEAILITLAFMGESGEGRFFWSLLIGLLLIYVNVILRMTIIGKSGYMFKLVSGIVFSVVILAGVDFATGYKGWSMELVYPCGIILLNVGIGLLMIINHRNWQSYMIIQLLAIALSLIPCLLLVFGIIGYGNIVIIATGISIFFFLGTLIIGDYRARTELKRRFHI